MNARALRPALLPALVVLLAALAPAWAQDPAVKPRVWVHAPAEDLLSLFPEKGAGFLITLDEYRRLVELAREQEARTADRPPLPARLVRGSATAVVDGDVLRIEAHYVAVVKSDEPVEVPFPLENVALERIAVEEGELAGSTLRFDRPGTYSISASLSVRLGREGEMRRASFRLPPAGAHAVRITLPAGVEGEVGPIVRAFRTGDDGGEVVGYPDAHGLLRLWFAPRAPARRLDPLVTASFSTIAEVGEARTVFRTRLELEILRAPLAQIELQLPAGLTIRALQGKGVRSWRLVRGDAGTDTLEIRFVDPVEGRATLEVEAEQPRDDAARAPIAILRVPDAARYDGSVGVTATPEVRLVGIDAAGVRRMDDPKRDAVAVFDVWSQEARIEATVERVEARTRADVRALLAFREGGKSLRIVAIYRIAGQPLFRLEPRLPAGWILRHLKLDGADAPHRYDETGRVVLDFPTGLKPGLHALDVLLDTDEVDWVPNEGQVAFELSGIRSGLADEGGLLVVASDPAFRVSAGSVVGLQPVGMPELARAGFEGSDQILYGWRFEQSGYAARFTLERHQPQITATVLNRVLASERLMQTHASVLLDIQRTGVRELRVALPKGTGPLVDFRGPLIKEKRAPADGADPEVWTLAFQKRVRGPYRLEIHFERKFEDDAWTAAVPEIALPGVSDRGYVEVHSSGTTAIEVTRGALREADVDELPESPSRPPLEVLAYGAHPYAVGIASRRHDPQEVVQAIALDATIFGVVSPDGRLRCRAEYRVRNNDQPFLACVLPPGATLLGAIVDGNPVKPLVEKGVLKLDLPRSRDRTTPFVVAIVYESEVTALGSTGELTIERPVLDIDVLKTRYNLHLPSGYEVTGHDGDLVPLDLRERATVLRSITPSLGIPFGADRSAPPASGAVAADDGKNVAGEKAEKALQYARRLEREVDRSAGEHPGGEEEELDFEADDDGVVAETRSASGAKKAEKSGDKVKAPGRARKGGPGGGAFRGPNGGVPPGARVPSDPESPPPAPAEEPMSDAARSAPTTPNADGKDRRFVAHGGPEGAPTPRPGGAEAGGGKRARPERALLSLDIQPLRPDNLVRLDSLAPTGSVTLAYARTDVFGRHHFLGVVLGAALGLMLVSRRLSLLRLAPAAVLGVLALHFAGLSFLPADFARGAAEATVAVLVLATLVAASRGLVGIARRRRIGAAALAVALAALAPATRAEEPDEILVPYRDDPARIDRVFLPADVYHRLRRLAYPETAGRATAFLDASYEAKLEGEVLAVTARYGIVKETAEAERVPLGLAGVAVTRAVLRGEGEGERPATLAVEKGGYVLVLAGKGRRTLELTLRPELLARGEQRAFSCPVRPVANAQLRLEHDRTDHEATVVSLGAETGGVWHLGPVGTLSATWTPRTEGFVAAAAELRAATEMVVAVRDGFTAVAARVRYGISGGTVERLRVRVGGDLAVREVRCADLAGWQIDADGNLVVALAKPADKAVALELFAERPAAARERTENAPVVEPLDVLRDAGVIALETLADLKIEVVDSQGLLRGSADQAPQGLAAAPDRGALHSVYRFAVRPFALRWRVFVEATRLRATTNVDLYLDRDFAYADVAVTVEVERGPGPFTIEIDVPAAYEVQTVRGPQRDWWVRDGRLTIDLAARQPQAAAYSLLLRRRLETAEPFEAPSLAVRGAAREAGLVRVAVADGLELEAGEAANLLPEDIAKVGGVRWGRLARAYRFVAVPWRLVLSTREEPREVDALVVSRVVPLADRVRVEALVNFHVRRGLVDELSFVVPVGREADALVVAPDLREERSEAVEGGRLYTLVLRTPTRGSASATVTYHLPYGEPLHGVEPAGVERTRRYAAIEKIPDGEVRIARATNLDAGDFDDLPIVPPGSSPRTVAGVYVGGGGPFVLGIEVKRHSFEEVAKAVVYRAAARAVVERAGWTRVVVSYRVYNRSEQFLRLALPPDARLYSVLVDGEGVRPLGEGADLLVPLRKVALGATTFDVDVLYGYRRAGVGETDAFPVSLPEVRDFEVRRTTLTLYVPKGFSYSFETDMEQVDEAYLAAGKADDIYQEAKEVYSVAERGNALQAKRALENFQVLEQQAQRAIDEVRANSRDRQQLKQVEAQVRKLQVLGKALREDREAPDQSEDGTYRLEDQERTVAPKDWAANDAYLERNSGLASKQVEVFKQAQERAREGRETLREELRDALEGVPQGGGAGGDRGGYLRGETAGTEAGMTDAPFTGPATNSALGLTVLDEVTAGLDDAKTGVALGETPSFGAFFNDGRDGDYRGRTENVFDRSVLLRFDSRIAPDIAPNQLRSAKGRISLRFDLPLEGEVFHFARLGARGAVSFDAEEKGGRFTEGFLAVLFFLASGAILVVRYGKRRSS